ncbi:MAG: GNAT family N-acetyltransferase [Desulfobacterales bacterium]|nr:GNAT family N-acetyltransferase [Desulfobacterales bacterium]
MTKPFTIVTGDDVDKTSLAHFLQRVYSPEKYQFVMNHGEWLYRGGVNQWIVQTDKEIVAYCAVIPVLCSLYGMPESALWWVDLIVHPKYRGKGIQTLIDQRMREVGGIKLGFPNALAAKIHRKHDWVVREDGDVLLLPLRPIKVNKIRRSKGLTGVLLRTAATIMLPAAWWWRKRILAERTDNARCITNPSPSVLADLFERFKFQYPVTIYRDESFWRWRYLSAPYRSELSFYLAGNPDSPSHCLVTRSLQTDGIPSMRILDIFGDLKDIGGFRQALALSIQDAIERDAAQVTAINFLLALNPVWRQLCFFVRTTGRFCCHSDNDTLMKSMMKQQHWVLGDSDNDAAA